MGILSVFQSASAFRLQSVLHAVCYLLVRSSVDSISNLIVFKLDRFSSPWTSLLESAGHVDIWDHSLRKSLITGFERSKFL